MTVAVRERPAERAARVLPLLALAAAVDLTLLAVHLVRGVHGDADPRLVYDPEGRALLHGTYPASPYPAGAVGLFALESLLGGSARDANALLMVPFHVLETAALFLLRTRWSGVLAAGVALWPANAYFWQFRFDLVPAAAVVGGVALARHGRWHAAGWALGAGAAVKWTPALTALALAAWLVGRRRHREAVRLALGAAIPFLAASLPAFVLAARAAAAPYRAQAVRGLTGESLPYLPLRLLGLARAPRHYYGPAHVPSWTTSAAAAAQLLAVGVFLVLAARAPDARGALGRAALAPAAFLLSNRIFSPQFFVVVLACSACAAALVLSRRRDVLLVSTLLGVATAANAVLYPGLAGAGEAAWTTVSALALLPAAAAVALLAARRTP